MTVNAEVVYTDGSTSDTFDARFNQISTEAATKLKANLSRKFLLTINRSTILIILCDPYWLLRLLWYAASTVYLMACHSI